MARVASLLVSVVSLFSSLSSITAQEFEISPEILLAGSPAAMLFAFLDTQEDFTGASQTLTVLPSVCKTEGIQKAVEVAQADQVLDCNLTGVDPECFLINIAGQVGKSWGSQLADEEKAAEMIEKLLKGRGLTLQAAAVACAAAPLVVPLLSQFGTEMASPAEVINEASLACRV
ncbi:hypothetical protein ACSSS7_006417 [Eimeria intestinalis]